MLGIKPDHVYLQVNVIVSAELSAYTETVRSKLRRSGVGNIAKARSRTLKMTVVIGKINYEWREIIISPI